MRAFDESSPDPRAAAALLALDATLAGEPADPEFAELAELALILRHDRPVPSTEFAAVLDERVARRFAPAAAGAAPGRDGVRDDRPGPGGRSRRSRRRWSGWGLAPGLGVAAALVVAIVVIAGRSGGGSSSASFSSASSAATSAASAAPSTHGSASAGSARAPLPASVPGAQKLASGHNGASGAAASAGSVSSSASSSISAPSTAAAGSGSGQVPLVPDIGNRQIVQSAQLQLQAKPAQINAVAQEVFGVVATEKGIVNSSSVTSSGAADGSAQFQLSVPSANLAATMSMLSRLAGAQVLSRTDSSNDITGQVGGAGMRLAEARALRTALLKQLAAAVTTAQIDSLQARLHDADASIASDLSTLRGLKRQVQYSQVAVTVQSGSSLGVVPAGGGGFTLHHAVHDAGRVLVVVAGVALIALAVLVPLALVAALLAWAGLVVRRRRREHALDLI